MGIKLVFYGKNNNNKPNNNSNDYHKLTYQLKDIKRQLNHVKMALGFTKESSQ